MPLPAADVAVLSASLVASVNKPTYDEVVGILERATRQQGQGFTNTACAEFILAVRQWEPEIADAFLSCMMRHGTPRINMEDDVRQFADGFQVGGRL